MGLFMSYLKKEAKKLHEEGVQLRVIGRRDRFSERIQKAIVEAEAIASEGSSTLVIAADYGGQWDMAQAAKQVAEKVASGELSAADVDEELLAQHICLADLPPLDLLIRTGGETRISNYLLWQAAYSELYFSECYWPDFDEAQLDLAVDDFYGRQRRFGKTSEQVQIGE
jgi:undecaprenyl diphosphate synthase